MLIGKRLDSICKNCEFPDEGRKLLSNLQLTNFQKVSLCTYNLNSEPQQLKMSAKALFLLVMSGVLFYAHNGN